MNKEPPKLSTDSLLKTSKKGDIELTDRSLGRSPAASSQPRPRIKSMSTWLMS